MLCSFDARSERRPHHSLFYFEGGREEAGEGQTAMMVWLFVLFFSAPADIRIYP